MESIKNMFFIAIVLFVFAIGFLVFHYVSGQVGDKLKAANVIKDNSVAVDAIDNSIALRERFDWIIFSVFMGLCLFSFLLSYFLGAHPIFIFIFFLCMLVLIPMSAILSNTWETVSQLSVFGSSLSSFPITNNLALRSPIYLTVIGFVNMVIMYISNKMRAVY